MLWRRWPTGGDQSQPRRTGGSVARSGDRPSSVHAAPSPPAYRRDRRCHHSDRSGGRRSGRALSHCGPTLDHHSRHQRVECLRHPRRNRPRHEPLPDRRTPDLLGRPVPEERRECRQAAVHRMRKGAPWLKTTLVQCAWAAARKKASYLQAQFHRLRARRGAKKAIGAVAASILTAAYHMLQTGTLYHDLGPNHFDKRAKEKHVHRLINRLQNLGFAIEITPVAAAA